MPGVRVRMTADDVTAGPVTGRTNSELEADVARLKAERDEARAALHLRRQALEAIHAGAETGLRQDPSGLLLNIESIARHALRDTAPSEER